LEDEVGLSVSSKVFPNLFRRRKQGYQRFVCNDHGREKAKMGIFRMITGGVRDKYKASNGGFRMAGN